ncbi:hypothetical protein FRC10_008914 [Ceratobasidium sp. 414]|nr:hypothetical protein FRC10_008914 [Ceratobasidium sp. 414]
MGTLQWRLWVINGSQATSDYRNSLKSPEDDELKPMTSEQDIRRIYDLIQSFPVVLKGNFRHALNERFSKSKLIKDLTELRRLSGPRFYYRMWAVTLSGAKNEENLFGHDAKRSSISDPSRRLSSNELSGLLVDPASPIPIQMIAYPGLYGGLPMGDSSGNKQRVTYPVPGTMITRYE